MNVEKEGIISNCRNRLTRIDSPSLAHSKQKANGNIYKKKRMKKEVNIIQETLTPHPIPHSVLGCPSLSLCALLILHTIKKFGFFPPTTLPCVQVVLGASAYLAHMGCPSHVSLLSIVHLGNGKKLRMLQTYI